MNLWQKLNLKDQTAIVIDDHYNTLGTMLKEAPFTYTSSAQSDTHFYLGFATTLQEVESHIASAQRIKSDDPVVWVAYPKQSSKKYHCEFNRDTGWNGFGAIGFEPVRQVAIDDDWSALRFRRVSHIKKMVRTFALTEEGKQKASQQESK